MGKLVIIFISLCTLTRCVLAQTLPDPTRPPGVMRASVIKIAEEAVVEPVLQSVLISPSRKIAVISGEIVALNGTFGDFQLVSITESVVLLKNGKSEKRLFLLFPVEQRFSNSSFMKKSPEQEQYKP
ncbi:MAG: MSHA biogenesis protein MshK [Candidatus Paceibacteria bacterium]|jgi:MSHA biogenesis protein MshK